MLLGPFLQQGGDVCPRDSHENAALAWRVREQILEDILEHVGIGQDPGSECCDGP
jgi:hypothetical protein